ncbi:CRISPR-associated protein Cas4 [Methanofollis fontis]|uniref:CRISPR-associated protein Cas4 n=1 Tax=Methanofollis fontis TaxID=2052832 RepID=UPI0013EE853F|nr:CRISPR-associated protein Cas4 [Methanofollis fontis]
MINLIEGVLLLLLASIGVFIFAIRRHYAIREVRDQYGIPEGELLYTDLDHPAEVLFSEKYRISGRPDYILRDEMTGDHIPVEVKSGRAKKPYWNHILQVAAYCLLVEEHYHTRVPYGVLVYGDGEQHRIDFTEDLRRQVLSTVDAMRECCAGTPVRRNHNASVRCRNCAYSDECRYCLGDM